jgi:hypothetical protein
MSAGDESPTLAAWGRRIGLHGVCIEHFLLTPAVVGVLRGADLRVTTGTVNAARPASPLLPLALDAITSDSSHEPRAQLSAAPRMPVAA